MNNMIAKEKNDNFYFGFLGAVLPFVVFLSLIIILSITKELSTQSAGAAAFVGVVVAFFLIKDKKEYSKAVQRGLTNEMLIVMIIAFLFVGVMAKAMELGGLVDNLVWIAAAFNISGKFIPLVIFLVGALIGLATGTSVGTIATMMPVMLPLGLALGCDPGLVIGAIVGGAMFGDNIAPISDTTIVSALTQETDVAKVVKARFKYSGAAGVIAGILYLYFGITTTSVSSVTAASVHAANPKALLLLLAPVVIVYLMLKGKDLVYSLTIVSGLSVFLCWILGLIKITDVISTKGVIFTGFASMMNMFPVFYFMFVMIELLKFGGVLEWMTEKAVQISKTPRTAEIVSTLICTGAYMITTSHAVSVVISGPLVRQVMKNFNIDRARSANLIDCIVSGLHGVMPHSMLTMITMGIANGMNVLPKGFVGTDYLFYVFHSWVMLIIFWGAILTGWGRKQELPEGKDTIVTSL